MIKMRICLATNNSHKILEIKQILGGKYELMTLKDIGHVEELPETGTTLEANSLEKASYLFKKYNIACMADDSGLEITSLGNEPGVDSAHYAGPQRNARDNMKKVLSGLANSNDRSASFKTVITFIDAKGNVHQFVGTVEGQITKEEMGGEGFGYDPIFLPNGHKKTFAEMTTAEKNAISHRAKALEKLQQFMQG